MCQVMERENIDQEDLFPNENGNIDAMNYDDKLEREIFIKECGRRKAQLQLYTEMYKAWYRIKPTKLMMDLEDEISNQKQLNKRELVFITVGSYNDPKVEDFKWWAIKIMQKVWVGKIWDASLERGAETGNLHMHLLISTTRYYSPGDIARFIWKDCERSKFCASKGAIEVTKSSLNDLKNRLDYFDKIKDVEQDPILRNCIMDEWKRGAKKNRTGRFMGDVKN